MTSASTARNLCLRSFRLQVPKSQHDGIDGDLSLQILHNHKLYLIIQSRAACFVLMLRIRRSSICASRCLFVREVVNHSAEAAAHDNDWAIRTRDVLDIWKVTHYGNFCRREQPAVLESAILFEQGY